jgi:hypothetical protein
MLHAPGKTSWLQSAILASALLAVACAPAAQPSPTAAPAKPAESKPAATTAAAKPTEAPSAKPAEVKPAASPAAAAKPAEAKPAASPAAKAEAKPAASPAAKAEPKAGLKRVTLRLDWVFQGPNAGFMIARDKGYYEQAGLDVTIGPGQGSGATAQAIANKTDMIGFSDGYVVGNTVSKGAELTIIAHQDTQGPGGQERRHPVRRVPVPAVAGLCQRLQRGCQQGERSEPGASRARHRADPGPSGRGGRIHPGHRAGHGNPRRQEDPCAMVRGLRRAGHQQWDHRPQ